MSLRPLYLQSAVANCEPPITLERVAALLPADFNLDQDELDGVLKAMRGVSPVAHPVENLSTEVLDHGSSTPTPTEFEVVPPTVAEAKQSLDEARVALRVLSDKLRIARGRLADCLQRYMRSRNAAAPTPDELRRDFCRQETENRKAKAAELVPAHQPTHGNSKLDRSLYYQGKGSGSIDDFGAIQNTGHRRGAMPASARGRRLRPAGA